MFRAGLSIFVATGIVLIGTGERASAAEPLEHTASHSPANQLIPWLLEKDHDLREIPFSEVNLLVVELNKSHTLERLCLYLLGAELNIRFAYPLLDCPGHAPTVAIAVDDATLAGQILRRNEFRLLGEEELCHPQ